MYVYIYINIYIYDYLYEAGLQAPDVPQQESATANIYTN